MMSMDMAPMGSLKDFLWAGNINNDNPSSRENAGLVEPVHHEREFPIWAAQVASAMIYLGSKNLVHRHLSAFNVFMTSKLNVKVQCTCVTRLIPTDSDSYNIKDHGETIDEILTTGMVKW